MVQHSSHPWNYNTDLCLACENSSETMHNFMAIIHLPLVGGGPFPNLSAPGQFIVVLYMRKQKQPFFSTKDSV